MSATTPATTSPPATAFVRDRFTWSVYLTLGYYTFLLTMLGPLAPVLQTRFHLSYSDIGLPTSAYAAGMLLMGLVGGWALHRFAMPVSGWVTLGVAVMAISALGLVLAPAFALAIFCSFLMGGAGAVIQIVVPGLLANHHQGGSAAALSETNAINSICACLPPVIIASLSLSGVRWPITLIIGLGALSVGAVLFKRLVAPTFAGIGSQARLVSPERSGPLPLVFWLYWLVFFCGLAAEWSLIVWAAPFLHLSGAISSDVASLLLVFFFLAEALGRWFGSRLARSVSLSALLLLALGITTCGFGLFWLMPFAPLKVAGLFVAGLGVANLFPLPLAAALRTVPHNAGTAGARLSLGVGLAMLATPNVLGRIADVAGIEHAYSIVPVLLLLGIAVTLLASRAAATI